MKTLKLTCKGSHVLDAAKGTALVSLHGEAGERANVSFEVPLADVGSYLGKVFEVTIQPGN